MSDLKVDFLVRDELIYELLCRGINFQEHETVDRLRKLLRRAIKDNAIYYCPNLKGKINLDSEIDLIKTKCDAIKNTTKDLTSESRIQDIVRVENKIVHTKSRVENLLKFQLKEASVNELKSCLVTLTEAKDLVSALNIKTDLKENYVRKVSESNEEEENLNLDHDEVFLSSVVPKTQGQLGLTSVNIVNKPVVPNAQEQSSQSDVKNKGEVSQLNSNLNSRANFQKHISQNEVENLSFDMSLYNKLSNPLERYLSGIRITNGLNIEELLNFIKSMLKIKREMKLPDRQILELLVHHCNDPLLNTLLACKEQNLSLSETNKSILETFIPHNMLDNMKRDLVNRPQKQNEPLSLYIFDIKENSEVLMCSYSESELVNIVKTGLNPDTRSKLVFCGDPKTFSDLELICVKFNNVSYADFCREKEAPALYKQTPHTQERRVVCCYNCGRQGHLAKNCFRRGEVKTSVKQPSKN